MKNKKLITVAFLILLVTGSQYQQASDMVYDSHGIGTDGVGNRLFHRKADDSLVLKMVTGVLRKTDAARNALDLDTFEDNKSRIGWKKLKVVDEQGNLVGRYDVDPQGTVFQPMYDQFGQSTPSPIQDPTLAHSLQELAARLDAIEVPDNL